MSYHEYAVSCEIASQDYPFYALLMAAMRKADTANGATLKRAFPDTFAELAARYQVPGGYLPSETVYCGLHDERHRPPACAPITDVDGIVYDVMPPRP